MEHVACMPIELQCSILIDYKEAFYNAVHDYSGERQYHFKDIRCLYSTVSGRASHIMDLRYLDT